MSDIIVHLEKGQIRQERSKLLRNDVYVLFHEFLRQKHEDGLTGLSQVEVFLAAERLARLLLELPNVVEGIDDELDDLEDEAEGVNDAILVSMMAAAIICAVKKRHAKFDWQAATQSIFARWNDHPLFFPMLQAAAHKEEERWMEGTKTNLLTCELTDIELNKEGEEAVEEVFQYFVDFSKNASEHTIKENLLVLNKYNNDHGGKYTFYIDELYEKLGINSRPQVYIAEQHNANCNQFMGDVNHPKFLTQKDDETN